MLCIFTVFNLLLDCLTWFAVWESAWTAKSRPVHHNPSIVVVSLVLWGMPDDSLPSSC